MHEGDSAALQFGRFVWLPARRQLLAEGRPVPLGSRALELLQVLLSQPAQLVSKDDLLRRAWPDAVVEESNLPVQIRALRQAVGEDAIQTVPGRGYRWALAVQQAAAPTDPAAGARRRKPSIAVLPLSNASGNSDDEYFADGLAEDVVASLSRSPWLMVIASSSSFQFRDDSRTVPQICGQLGVNYLLRGSMRRGGARIRVTVELVDGASSDVVWAERYDRPDSDLFLLQDEICARIVGTLEPAYLKQEERRAVASAERDLQHWDLVMRARWHYWRSSQRHSAECRRLLEQALRRRPDDVATLSLLAFSLATEVWSGWASDARAIAAEALRLATRAVALDDSDAFAHFTLGVTLLGTGQLHAAMAEQRRALALYPHFAAAAAELGRLLTFSGEVAEGRRLTEQAMAHSPTDPRMALWVWALGIGNFIDGRFAEAAQHARSAVALRRDWFFNHLLLAASCIELGDEPAARAALAEGVRLLPTLSEHALRFGHPFGRPADHERYVRALRSAGWTG
jgi:TolB-like protein/Tfp pilus assembly protein PilF